MLERFTEAAKSVLVEARDLAVELDSSAIDIGHLLYGCAEGREESAGRPLHDCGITGAFVRSHLPRGNARAGGPTAQPNDGVDAEALRAIGIDFVRVKSAVEVTFGPGALERAPDRRTPVRGRKPPFTADAKQTIQHGLQVAHELHHQRIAPGHLLLGLLRVDGEVIRSVLEDSRTTAAALSASVHTQLANAA